MNQNPPDNATEPRSIASLAAALLDSGNVMVIGDGCSTRLRDLWILTDIIVRHLEPKKPKCPHCGSGLLWSEDRGAHCDGCDDFNPETDLENAINDPATSKPCLQPGAEGPNPSAAGGVAPACPAWKTPKHLADLQEHAKVRAMTLEDALPSSVHRLSWLKDRDAQLRQLLDYLDSVGIPMGSDTWALRTLLRLRWLEAESEAAWRVLRALNNKELPDLERMRLDFEHARALYVKRRPPMETRCDYCGWPGARLIGGGYAACEDCLPTDTAPISDLKTAPAPKVTNSALFALAVGTEIKYRVTWPRGEPSSEERTGVIEGRDGDYHLPMKAYGRADSYHSNGNYLVRCTSCQHHRIDSVHPHQIIEENA